LEFEVILKIPIALLESNRRPTTTVARASNTTKWRWQQPSPVLAVENGHVPES
jgi:hypothetical protein